MISINNLNFKYKNRPILKNISFKAEEGDLICVLGPNGVGKSTLFKCILGLLKGYKGEILINNSNIKNLSRKLMAREIAYIPQSHYPTFNFSVFNVILMGTTSHFSVSSSPSKKEEDLVNETLEKLGISYLKDRGYGEISGGERQLVLIARALTQKAKVLIMDEPTANLDYGNQVRVMKKVKELSNEGYTIILSTHNPEHAFLYANKVMVMYGGEITNFGVPKDVLTESLLKKIYNVKVNLHDIEENSDTIRVCVPLLN